MADSESSQRHSIGRSVEHSKNSIRMVCPKRAYVSIEGSPSPQILNSVEPEPIGERPMASDGSSSRQSAKRRELEEDSTIMSTT